MAVYFFLQLFLLLLEIIVRTGSFLEAILDNLRCRENDYAVLFALCLLHAISTNAGMRIMIIHVY